MVEQDPGIGAAVGDESYLIDPGDWNEEIAVQLARQEKISLTQEHWQVIGFIRDWHADHGVAPSARDVAAFMKAIKAPRNFLYTLFPYGYVQQACKIAGMKKPRSWSTG